MTGILIAQLWRYAHLLDILTTETVQAVENQPNMVMRFLRNSKDFGVLFFLCFRFGCHFGFIGNGIEHLHDEYSIEFVVFVLFIFFVAFLYFFLDEEEKCYRGIGAVVIDFNQISHSNRSLYGMNEGNLKLHFETYTHQ